MDAAMGASTQLSTGARARPRRSLREGLLSAMLVVTLLASCGQVPAVTSPTPATPARTFDLPDATTLPSAEAWALVRSALPPTVPVLRPTDFPAGVRADLAELLYARQSGEQWYYAVSHHGATAASGVTIALGPVNSANPRNVENVTVRGHNATLAQSDGSPKVMVFWRESGYLFTVFADDLSKDDILRVANSLR